MALSKQFKVSVFISIGLAEKENQVNLTNKVIAITGGARGLGFAMAERLGNQGAQVSAFGYECRGIG